VLVLGLTLPAGPDCPWSCPRGTAEERVSVTLKARAFPCSPVPGEARGTALQRADWWQLPVAKPPGVTMAPGVLGQVLLEVGQQNRPTRDQGVGNQLGSVTGVVCVGGGD